MMKIEIFNPHCDLSEGAEGLPDDSVVDWLNTQVSRMETAGIEVQIYGLDSDPLAFAEHAGIAELLQAEGEGVLPATFIDGRPVATGRYLTSKEVERAAAIRGVRVVK